jgi:hypothetical protein
MKGGSFTSSHTTYSCRHDANYVPRYISRFHNAAADHPSLREFPLRLTRWLERWSSDSWTPALSSNERGSDKNRLANKLKREIEQLSIILGRDETQSTSKGDLSTKTQHFREDVRQSRSEMLIALNERAYEPPGELRESGPRHNNDHADIKEIAIVPSMQELTCNLPSYIPATIHDAPHHLPIHSMDRLMDIQFRLLREEFV